MKKFVLEFVRRGFIACGFGPLVLAIVYLILQKEGNLQTLSVNEVCLGIFSLSVLAFIAGGLNALYQMERLPLMAAILIHGGVLYVCYLITYLLNDWLDRGTTPLLVFSGIFVLGYLIIWAIIYTITKNKTDKLNQALQEQQI
ncbi:MAG: DUF3021 domain-containing protein [Lachnospiraceae bacterium]|nr:DUF3021 domain-containing protein [Lachnospiraceae bacterium]